MSEEIDVIYIQEGAPAAKVIRINRDLETAHAFIGDLMGVRNIQIRDKEYIAAFNPRGNIITGMGPDPEGGERPVFRGNLLILFCAEGRSYWEMTMPEILNLLDNVACFAGQATLLDIEEVGQ